MRLSLVSVLLPALLIPIVMTYRIGWGDTPFWLFGLIFLGLFAFIFIDVIHVKERHYYPLKSALLWFLILVTIGSTFIAAIVVRHQTAPIYNIHDIILQLEAAIRFFLHGINPYATTYFGTPLEAWNYSPTEVNPALYYFVMEPFYLLFSIPFYLLSTRTIGYFDGRMPLLFLFLALLWMVSQLIKDKEKRMLAVVLLAFNPAMFSYVLEGRSDMFMYPFMFASFYLLHKNKIVWSAVLLALAFAVKQSAWFLFPFYAAFLYFKYKNVKKTAIALIPFFVTFSIIVLPFLAWNYSAFLESTVGYLSGSVAHSYPISGYGFGVLMHQFGYIKELNAYYPFIIWQLVVCVSLLFYFLYLFRKNPSIKMMIIFYGLFLLVYWYFSRYFNNSHIGFLSMVFITGYFWPEDNK